MPLTPFETARLAYADVVTYKALLKALRDDEDYRGMNYQLFRSTAIDFHRTGSRTAFQRGIERARKWESSPVKQQATSARNNIQVMEVYQAAFTTPFLPLAPSPCQKLAITVNGLKIEGRPHFAVQDGDRTKYHFLLTSKELSLEEKKFLLALISELVTANIPGTVPEDIEGLDCRTGMRMATSGLKIRLRSRLESIAEILVSLHLN